MSHLNIFMNAMLFIWIYTMVLYKIISTDISNASMVYWCILSFFNDWGTGSNPVVGLTITELSIHWFFFRVKDLNTSYSDARNRIWHSKFFVLSFLFSTELCIRWNIMTISGMIEKNNIWYFLWEISSPNVYENSFI